MASAVAGSGSGRLYTMRLVAGVAVWLIVKGFNASAIASGISCEIVSRRNATYRSCTLSQRATVRSGPQPCILEVNMDSNNTSEKKSLWFKDLLNGYIVSAIAFLLYVIPAFVVAILWDLISDQN